MESPWRFSILPFLNKKMMTTLLANTKPSGNVEIEPTVDGNPGLEAAMEELISAIHMKDVAKAVSAFQSAFELMEPESE